MSAVDEIQAAIDKLTDLKATTTLGPWRTDGPDYHFYNSGDGDYVNTSLISAGDDRVGIIAAMPPVYDSSESAYEVWSPRATADMALIVTLHATIDAQLAILNDFMDRYAGRQREDWVPIAPSALNPLNLARAITGTTHAPR